MRSIKLALVAAALFTGTLALAPSHAFAADEVNVTAGKTETGSGLAARGYDVVAYFTDSKAVLGDAKFTAVHNNATYRFASQEHLDLFKANPDKYTPQFGGFCAFGCFVGKKFDGDPTLWKIVDGKLYFNLNPTIQQKWSEDTKAKIEKANENWQKIEKEPVSETNK